MDFNCFARAMIWQEFWFERENNEEYEKPIFKSRKNNLPKNYSTPKGLKTMLSSIRSEIMDPQNRNQEHPNLLPEEIEALKELITLQKQRIITIKPADKGAGIVILNFKDYMKSSYDHLLSNVTSQNVEGPKTYYKAVNEFALEEAKEKIENVLHKALENKIISREEYNEMNPHNEDPAKFYCNFKVHKETNHHNISPVRPIISGSGSITENISLYAEHYIKESSVKHPSYLQDTPHFLRVLHKLNSGQKLSEKSMLVTADITGAYANIPQENGSHCLFEVLEERQDKSIPSEFIVELMDLIQQYNIFEFHDGQL